MTNSIKTNVSAKGFVTKVTAINNKDNEQIGINFLLANGSEKYQSSINVTAWGDTATKIQSEYSEKGKNFVFIDKAHLNGRGYMKDGENKLGNTSIVANSIVPGKTFVQGADDNQIENITARGFVTHITEMKGDGNGVTGLMAFTVGEGEKAVSHTVKLAAFNEVADFLKELKGDLIQLTESRMNGSWKEGNLMPNQIIVSDLVRLKVKTDQGYVDNVKSLQEFTEENSNSQSM